MENIKRKNKKIIDGVEYDIVRYYDPVIVHCSICNRTILSDSVIYFTENEKKSLCNLCYRKKLKKRKLRDSETISKDTEPKNYYSRVPLLQKKATERGRCMVCNNKLKKGKITLSLFNNKDIFEKNVVVQSLFCDLCKIGYADTNTSKYIRMTYPGMHADMFIMGEGKIGKISKEALWQMINSEPKVSKDRLKIIAKMETKNTQTEIEISKNGLKASAEVKTKNEQSEIVPVETEIWVDMDPSHECNGPMAGTLRSYSGKLLKSSGRLLNVGLKKCPRCKKIFISETEYETYKDVLNKYNFILRPEPIHTIEAQDFITRVNVFHCTGNNHHLRDVRCSVRLLLHNGEIIQTEIPGAFCPQCKKYYILESEYQKLKEKGIIVCKVVEFGFWENGTSSTVYNLKEESILHMHGYNVNAYDNISQAQRWRILEMCVDEKILSRAEICSHLDYLINKSKYRKNYEQACSKWKTDRDHIMSYKRVEMEKIEVNSISAKTRRSEQSCE